METNRVQFRNIKIIETKKTTWQWKWAHCPVCSGEKIPWQWEHRIIYYVFIKLRPVFCNYQRNFSSSISQNYIKFSFRTDPLIQYFLKDPVRPILCSMWIHNFILARRTLNASWYLIEYNLLGICLHIKKYNYPINGLRWCRINITVLWPQWRDLLLHLFS